jgi:hypothetical protein
MRQGNLLLSIGTASFYRDLLLLVNEGHAAFLFRFRRLHALLSANIWFTYCAAHWLSGSREVSCEASMIISANFSCEYGHA